MSWESLGWWFLLASRLVKVSSSEGGMLELVISVLVVELSMGELLMSESVVSLSSRTQCCFCLVLMERGLRWWEGGSIGGVCVVASIGPPSLPAGRPTCFCCGLSPSEGETTLGSTFSTSLLALLPVSILGDMGESLSWLSSDCMGVCPPN